MHVSNVAKLAAWVTRLRSYVPLTLLPGAFGKSTVRLLSAEASSLFLMRMRAVTVFVSAGLMMVPGWSRLW